MPQHQTKSTADTPLPRVVFEVTKEEAKATPQGSALILSALIQRFELAEMARELEMDKHHGVSIEHLLLVFLLFSAYGATSISDLEDKAKKDTSLASIMGGISEITQRVLHYYAERHDESTLDQLLDRFTRRAQETARFESREDGILALDDSTFQKFGKSMEHIQVVYDHCDKRYYLGYVVVSTCYCDATKAYPVNFQFRIQTEEEKRRAEDERLKKDASIDFRKKGALADWLQVLKDNGRMPRTLSLVKSMASVEGFKQVDNFQVPWVAAAHERLPLHDIDGKKRWKWEDLKRKTLGNKPDVTEVEGLKFYTKEVSLPGYDRELDFVVVTDFVGKEFDVLLLPRVPHQERVARILDFFEREGEPEASKLHLGVKLIRRAKDEAKIKAPTVAADSWFFVVWFVKALLEIPGIKRVVSRLKVNQQVFYKGQWLEADQLWNTPGLQFRHERKKGFKWASLVVGIEGLGDVRVVLVRELDKTRSWRVIAQYMVVCSDPAWSPLKAVAAYKLRWGIECFYRTAKQRFGMTEFHCTHFAAIYFHMTFVFLTYLMTAVLRQMTPTLLDRTLGEVIDLYLRCLVSVKRRGAQLIVLLGPKFAEDFGLPTALSP